MNASELRFWLDKIGSLPWDFTEEAETSIQSLEVTLAAVVQHLSSSGPAELGDLVVGQMCQKLLDTVRQVVSKYSSCCVQLYEWPDLRRRLEQQLHAVRACIDSRLSWGSQAPSPDTSRLELHHALDLFRNEFAPAAVVQDAANKLGLLQQEMQTLRSEFAPAAVVQDAANKLGLLQQEMQTLRSEFASAAVVQEAADKLGLLQQEMQTLRSEFAPTAVLQDAANKLGLMEAQQQNMLDSLRRERSGLIQQLSGLAAAARSSDSASEASWVRPSCGGSDTQGSSVTSGISVETSGGNCFMRDAAFKSETGALVPGSALHKGQQVLAANGSVLEVANEPEDHEARATVLLKAGAAELEVTPDHRVLLSDNRMVRAQDLRVGDEVLVGGLGPAGLQYVDVKFEPVMVRKIVFQPDLPVEVLKPSILSHGDKQSKRIRRGGRNRRGSDRQENCTIPDTEGYLTD